MQSGSIYFTVLLFQSDRSTFKLDTVNYYNFLTQHHVLTFFCECRLLQYFVYSRPIDNMYVSGYFSSALSQYAIMSFSF